MDEEAVLNRCLWDVTEMARSRYETVGDNARGRQVRVPFEDSVQGYQLIGSQLRPMDLSLRSSTDFRSYATRWEERYSALIPNRTARTTLVPVVSTKSFLSAKLPAQFGGTKLSLFPIVAHYGVVGVEDIIVLRKYATTMSSTERINALERLLDQGVEAYVEENYPGGGWGPFAEYNNIGPNNFTVLTDPEGRILAILGASGSEPGLESEDPISYLMIGIALVGLATKGGRLIYRLISDRAARNALKQASARVLTRLRNTVVDLQGKNPKRTLEVLTSPKVFRHTLTGDILPVNYARIEMEGSLRLSTGVKAHYGEGVYAWQSGATGVQTYIDVEVPAGTGVETLEVGGQSWVRMVPPEGDRLTVRIVGTNMPKEQIEFGRKLLRQP